MFLFIKVATVMVSHHSNEILDKPRPKQHSLDPRKADAKTALESRMISVVVDVDWITVLEIPRLVKYISGYVYKASPVMARS